jgi:putative transposase
VGVGTSFACRLANCSRHPDWHFQESEMLNDEELAELCQKHKLCEFAQATVREVRRSVPSRIVRSGTHNVVTHYASRKMGCVIKAEASRTELAAIYAWDHDRATYEFYDQPPAIKKIHDRGDGRTSTTLYTPDFFLLADDFIGWVECKAEGWLREQEAKPSAHYVRDKDGNWRCPAAERYAQGVGLSFAVRSSAESDPIVTQNIADLSDYYRDDCPAPTKEQLEIARRFMGDAGWCWLRDLLAVEVGLTADTVYKLIASEQMHVDLQAFPLMNEPHRVRVFATKALMDSRDLWLPAMLAAPDVVIHQVDPVPGAALLWDGKACEILNLGQTEIFLRMGGGALQSLPMGDFERLVRQGVICGTQDVANPRAQAAAQRLRQATGEDVKATMHRYYCIHPELCPPDTPHKASDRAIRKWKAMARQGYAEYGNEFIGLIPTTSRRGNRERRYGPRTLEIMREVIDTEVLSDKASGLFTCWSTVVDTCKMEGLLVPSIRTFQTEIKRLTTPEEFKKAREGEKAGYDLELPYISLDRETPRHGTRPFEIAHIDHTELDLQFVNESTGTAMGKAWLTVMIDAFTRVILAWALTFNDPSYRSCMLVVRDCVRRHGRIPRTVVVDQGSDFKGIYFDQLLAHFGVHKRMRPASHPRFGNIVERFFGVKNANLTHALRGNNKALQTPRRMSATHDPRNLAVWNLRAFREAFEGYLTQVYHAVEHPALGVSPSVAQEIGLLQSGCRSHTLVAYDRNFLIATMPTTDKQTSKIQKDGSFKANRVDYFSESLRKYVGRDLAVRYDPYDISRAYAMGDAGWIEARSMYSRDLEGRTEKEIEAISQEVDAINARTGIRLKDRAAALGAYFRTVREREVNQALELQQARDKALRAADEGIGLLGTQAAASGVDPDVPVTQEDGVYTGVLRHSSFENITQKTLKEF